MLTVAMINSAISSSQFAHSARFLRLSKSLALYAYSKVYLRLIEIPSRKTNTSSGHQHYSPATPCCRSRPSHANQHQMRLVPNTRTDAQFRVVTAYRHPACRMLRTTSWPPQSPSVSNLKALIRKRTRPPNTVFPQNSCATLPTCPFQNQSIIPIQLKSALPAHTPPPAPFS